MWVPSLGSGGAETVELLLQLMEDLCCSVLFHLSPGSGLLTYVMVFLRACFSHNNMYYIMKYVKLYAVI